ncbi:MAG: pentapeptide repeat-containing protein [Pseudomonadota bacterium]
MNAVNQAGNPETQDWIKRFLAARAEASLELLFGHPRSLRDWTAAMANTAAKVLSDPQIVAASPGSPSTRVTSDASSVNCDATVEGYSAGQFLADVLLLGQLSVRSQVLDVPVSIAGLEFPFGFDGLSAKLTAPFNARNATFGRFSFFECMHFADVDFADCRFEKISVSLSTFHGATSFKNASFDGPASFTARFYGPADFRGAGFHDSTYFEGAVFERTPDFTDATFYSRTTFAHSTFRASAKLAGASFPGVVDIGFLQDDVADEILRADHP